MVLGVSEQGVAPFIVVVAIHEEVGQTFARNVEKTETDRPSLRRTAAEHAPEVFFRVFEREVENELRRSDGFLRPLVVSEKCPVLLEIEIANEIVRFVDVHDVRVVSDDVVAQVEPPVVRQVSLRIMVQKMVREGREEHGLAAVLHAAHGHPNFVPCQQLGGISRELFCFVHG